MVLVLPSKMMEAVNAWKKIGIRNPEEEIGNIFDKYSVNDPRCSTKLPIVINNTIETLISFHIDMPSYGKNSNFLFREIFLQCKEN